MRQTLLDATSLGDDPNSSCATRLFRHWQCVQLYPPPSKEMRNDQHRKGFRRYQAVDSNRLPESDRYVFRLGAAVYGFASVSSFMAEVICHMDPEKSRPELEAKMGDRLADAFKQTVTKIEHLEPEAFTAGQQAYELFRTLNHERSDIIHSYPITSTTGNQILHQRQDATEPRGQGETLTSGKPAKHFEVTDEFMDIFLARLHQANEHLYRIRDIFRPALEAHATVPEEDTAL